MAGGEDMKTPAFWYKSIGPRALALWPLTLAYRTGFKWRRSRAMPYYAKVPVICVGNVVAGGSGKTPMALAVAAFLRQQGHKPAFVTRGYGGRCVGPLRVNPLRHTAKDVGDEALLLARAAPVWIGRDRNAAIREAEKTMTHIILDDGLQNPTLAPDISFLVIDGETGLGNKFLLPAGPLREPLADVLERIEAVILIGGRADMVPKLRKAGIPENKIVRARLKPKISPRFPREHTFFAFAGIAHPDKFYRTCRTAGLTLTGTMDFPDHHPFSKRELKALANKADHRSAQLLTTEKDWVRLPPSLREDVLTVPVVLEFEKTDLIKRLLSASGQKKTARSAR
jgi:tetraacyldisaccharide 4'-kinase